MKPHFLSLTIWAVLAFSCGFGAKRTGGPSLEQKGSDTIKKYSREQPGTNPLKYFVSELK